MNDAPSDDPGSSGFPDQSAVPDQPDDVGEHDGGERGADGTHTALPPKVESWRRRSATGAILTGFALGLQQALEKKREDPSIVVVTSGDPPDDLPVEADFEYGRPRHSVVNIRPWLLSDPDATNARLSTSGPDKGAGDGDHDDYGTGWDSGTGRDRGKGRDAGTGRDRGDEGRDR